MTEDKDAAGSAQAQTESRTFADGCRGFAAMFRSGAYGPEDQEMVAKKFEAAAAEIERLEALWFNRPYANGRFDGGATR